MAYAKSISSGIIMFTALARGGKKTSNLLGESRGTIRVPVFCDEESPRSDRGGSRCSCKSEPWIKPSVANKGEARQNNVIDSLISGLYHFGDPNRFHAYPKSIEGCNTRD